MSTAIRDDTERDAISDTDEMIVMAFEDESTSEIADWIARMKSEMEREMKRMEVGDDLILIVKRRMVFWMMMTGTRNTVMADDAVSIIRGGKLVTLLVWLSFTITYGGVTQSPLHMDGITHYS